MQVLELEPLRKQKLELVLIEPEFPIAWSLEDPKKDKLDEFWNLKLVSDNYMTFLEGLIKKHSPAFAAEEKGSRTDEEFLYDNPLVDLFKKHGIDYGAVDISKNALGYLDAQLDPLKSLQKSLEEAKRKIMNSKDESKRNYLEDVTIRSEYLKGEIISETNLIKYQIREAWMLMGALDKARATGAKKITGLFICNDDHFDGISLLAEQLAIDVTKIKIKKSVINMPESDFLNEFMKESLLSIHPIKIKGKKSEEKILYMFDTDEHASPFDINMAYDAGFNAVVPFSGVKADTVTRLVQDAMFSRKPSAPTCFFVGGSEVAECNKIAKKVLKALFPPFEHPVVIDPRGSHTTASSVVAKTLDMCMKHDIGELAGKKVVVMGCGPVGQIAAIIAAKERCNVFLVETWDKASEESVEALASTLNEEAGSDAIPITGKFAPTSSQKVEILRDADIIWAVATAGVQVVPGDVLEQLPPGKMVIDINAVPPSGIEGLKAKHEDKEIAPGIFGTGALALGGLKYITESNMLKKAATTKGMKVFNYNLAFETAKELLFGKKVVVTQ